MTRKNVSSRGRDGAVRRAFAAATLIFAFAVPFCLAVREASAATIDWKHAGGSNAWLTAGNWEGGVVPGTTDIAQFGPPGFDNAYPSGSPPNVQVNYSNPTNNGGANQAVGAISVLGSKGLKVTNNNTPAGVLTLNGATVNGQANTILNMTGTAAGTLQLVNDSSGALGIVLGNASNYVQSNAAGTVQITSTVTQVSGGSSITFLGGGNGATTGGTLVLDTTGTNTFSGGITAGKADGSNAGTVRIDRVGALPTAGDVTINANSQLLLNLAGAYGGGSQTITINGPGTPANSGAVRTLSGAAVVWNGNLALGSDSIITPAGGSGSLTINGNVSGAFQLNKAGAGALIFSGANGGYGGSTWLANGSITVNAGSMLGAGALKMGDDSGSNNVALTLNNAAQTIGSLSQGTANVTRTIALGAGTSLTIKQTADGVYNGAITGGAGSLVLDPTSTHTLTLGGTNTYGGGTTISGGILALTNAASLPAAGAVVVSSGGQLNLDKGSTIFGTLSHQLTLNGAGPAALVDDGALKTTKSGVEYRGSVTIATDSIVRVSSGGDLTLSGNISGGGKLQKQGGASLILSGTGNTATGTTQVGNGSLTVAGGSQLLSGDLIMAQTPGNNTSLTLNNATQSVGNLSTQWSDVSGTQSQTINLNGTTLIVNQSGTTTFGDGAAPTLTGVIAGSGSLVKQGAGTLAFTGVQTYLGSTTIFDGTLLVNGQLSNSAVTVHAGGSLGGGGSILGSVTLDGGALLPGASPGTLDVGSLAVVSASSSIFELGSLAGPNDQTTVNGDLNLQAPLTIDIVNAGGLQAGVYTLFDYGGVLTGFANVSLGTTPGGFAYSLVNNLGATSIDLQVAAAETAAPEPKTIGLFGLAALLLAASRRRRS